MYKDSRIMITGAYGFLGSAVVEELKHQKYKYIIPLGRRDADLRHQEAADDICRILRPDVIIHLAATVGGIKANKDSPGSFFYDNMSMGMNLIECARFYNINKFVNVGTTCSFGKYAAIPFKESDLFCQKPEESNLKYAVAKMALGEMLDGYYQEYGMKSVYLIPTNLMGERDNFNENTSHVIPALIKKCLDAKRKGENHIRVWGTGTASRDFLYVRDAAKAIIKGMEILEKPDPINIGSGSEIKISDLVYKVAKACDFNLKEVVWESDKPDGQPRRCLDTTKAWELLKWKSETTLEEGLKKTVKWYTGDINGK